MECFTDAQGRFIFPGQLFPELPESPALPPTVSGRRDAIEREFGVLKAAGIERNYKWAVNVFQFQDTWGDLLQLERGEDMLAQAHRIINKLASGSTQFAGPANYMLGLLATSDNASRVHYRTALKKGFERAWYRVAVKAAERGEKDSALSRFRRGAERGDSACLYTLGLAYLKGLYRLKQSTQEGLQLIEEALHGTDADFPRAPYVLGKILLGEGGDVPNGLGLNVGRVSPNRERGIELVQQSALLGFAPALLRMGQARQSKEFGFDCGVALRYMSLAAEQEAYKRFRGLPTQLRGDPESNIIKWLLCGYKDVVRVNEQWAFRFAEVGAAERNGTALFALGYFYEVGVNTDTDAAKAIDFYREGAREGCAAASARLDQMATNKPNLRRTLTRQDHNAKMRKHRTALISGEGDAGLAAINDQSTLEYDAMRVSSQNKVPSPIPEPEPQPVQPDKALPSQPRPPPYPESPERSPQGSMSDLAEPHRGPSLSSLSSGPSMHSVASSPSALPYPVAGERNVEQPDRRFSQTGSFRSMSEHPTLPYPDEYGPKIPLKFGGPLPYPRSPESPRRAQNPDDRVVRALQSASLGEDAEAKPRPSASYRSFSSGPGTLQQAQPHAPFQQQPAGFRRGHGATMSTGNVPFANRGEDQELQTRSSYSLQTLSESRPPVPPPNAYQSTPEVSSRFSTPSRLPAGSQISSTTTSGVLDRSRSIQQEASSGRRSTNSVIEGHIPASSLVGDAAYPDAGSNAFANTSRGASASSLNLTPAPGRTGSHTVLDAAPISARNSLHSASGEIPNLAPSLPMSGSDSALNKPHASSQKFSRVESARTSPSPSMQARGIPSNVSTPMDTPSSSRPTSPSPSPPLDPPDGLSSPGSPGSAGSPGKRRKARPLSSGWVRESFLPGASRFFSASQPQIERPGYVDAAGPEAKVRQRSPSPLRKMFKSVQDHRSVTDSAALQKPKGPDPAVANMPKVPVRPIQEKREPGVAYTFEDMGVNAVTNAKNDKCIIA